MAGLIKFRPYQKASFRRPEGTMARIWRRQAGKSYLLGAEGLDLMMESRCLVVYVSAALRLGMENLVKEATIWREVTALMRSQVDQAGQFKLTTSADDDAGRLLDPAAIAGLMEDSKLEIKLYHDRANYSRSIVVAPNPDTAVGWTGHIILDEVGRIPNFKEVWEAMEPIVSSNPQFRVRMATTPPPDDSHESYELLAPEPGEEFEPQAHGNFYTSQGGFLVHRVDAWDAYAAGVPIYDLKNRAALTPKESRASAYDKDAWDRNYGCEFLSGGTAAISSLHIANAQAAGDERGCLGVDVTEPLVAA